MSAANPSAFAHRTVLLDESLAFLAPRSGGVYVDVTLGGGGHAAGILAASSPAGRVIGLDRDPKALEAARRRLADHGKRFVGVHSSFAHLPAELDRLGLDRVDGLVADLGVSSPQLDDPVRGFSFREPGPLDMRMDPTQPTTARSLIASLDEAALADVLYLYGEERKSRAIARSIKAAEAASALSTTADLRRAVLRAMRGRRTRIDPATRTFQALRIAVNEELSQLETLLSVIPQVLADGAVAVVISFHSLEDRLVKHAFRDHPLLQPLTKKPVIAGEQEAVDNPRARSAKLRAARRVLSSAEAAPESEEEGG